MGICCRCCNTCEDVREAYRQKGWAINKMENIEQCKREGWEEKFKEEEGEGCRVYGYLEVNKVRGFYVSSLHEKSQFFLQPIALKHDDVRDHNKPGARCIAGELRGPAV